MGTPALLAPDVGEIFDIEGVSYRVTCWLRRRPARSIPVPEDHPDRRFWEEMATVFPPTNYGPDQCPLEFCRREDAEYVSGTAAGGRIVRVREVTVTGTVDWPAVDIAMARQRAERMAGHPVV